MSLRTMRPHVLASALAGAAAVALAALPVEAAGSPPGSRLPGPPPGRDTLKDPSSPKPDDPVSRLVEGSNAYALELCAKLAPAGGNLFFSPHASHASLALVLAGARGRTASELERVLHVPPFSGDRREAFQAALSALRARLLEDAGYKKPASAGGEKPSARNGDDDDPESEKAGGPRLALAVALWGQKGIPWSRETFDLLARHHGAVLREADFRGAPDRAREAIDDWAAAATGGRIREIAPPLTPLDVLALASAVYFRGRWEEEFVRGATKPAPFRVSAARSVEVPMMRQSKVHRYFERASFQALELRYRDGPFSMVILLPKGADGLKDLERELNPERLSSWLGALEDRQVDVSLPRFKIESSLDLKAPIQALGAPTIYSQADFSGFSPDLGSGTFLRCSLHRAIVSVDEEGTEAAAVDLEVITFGVASSPDVVFRADHPFIFLIRHLKTGAILFIGRLVDPAPSSASAERDVRPESGRSRGGLKAPRRRVRE